MIRINYDALGIATSVACAIHCAILPLILSSLPLFGVNIINNSGFEVFMILLAFAIGSYSLWHGYAKHHHKIWPFLFFSVGIFLLILKQFDHQHLLLYLIPAVILMISGHWTNFLAIRKARHCGNKSCVHA